MTELAPTGSRPRWRRWLVALLAVIVAVELLYVLAANLFLNTPVASWAINRKPEKIRVEWASGWTVVPGIAHVKSLRLRGQQQAVQWYAEIDSVRVHCRLLPLITKTFRAHSARGSGLDFRLRQRLDPDEVDEHADAVPPIPGFDTRHRDVPTAALPPKPERRNPWVVAIDDISIEEVGDLWIERNRFTGEGRLSGGFQFEIQGALEVDDVRLNVAGDLTSGNEPVASQLALDIEAWIDPVVPKEHKGLPFFRFLTTTVRLEAPQANLGFIDAYFRNASWLGLDGSGAVDADVTLEKGVLTTGSRVTASEASFILTYLDSEAEGDGRLEARVRTGDDGPEALIEAALSRFALRGHGASTPHVRGSDLTFEISSPSVDLTEPEPGYALLVDLPTSEVTDLGFYNSYLPPSAGIEVLSGTATIAGHLALSTVDDTGSGTVELRGKKLHGRFGDLDLTGDLVVTTRLADADVEARRFDLSGSQMTLDGVVIGDPKEASSTQENGKTWWGRFDLPEGKVRWAKPLEIDVRGTAQVRDSRPIIALVAQKKPLLRWMKPILAVQDLELDMGLQSNAEGLTIDDLVLTGDGLEVRADLTIVDKTPHGFVYLDRGILAAGLELADGERDWRLRKPKRWYEQQTGHTRDP